jgi:hypothetical protein
MGEVEGQEDGGWGRAVEVSVFEKGIAAALLAIQGIFIWGWRPEVYLCSSKMYRASIALMLRDSDARSHAHVKS